MVKRTAEKVLVIIGAVIFLISAVTTAIGLGGASDSSTANQLSGMGYSQEEISLVTDLVGGISIWFLVVYIICAILGFVSLRMLKPDRQAKGAGILLIITAVLGTILTVFTGFISGILYLIAGIMAIVRKPVEQYNDRGETY
ncbi:DUF4064 domain-containing protein [Terribacillus sp. JSM ZJ617]|uniref:DUF4064 domain-containing protein n=1 Tax=Terribacillus sp. JSM ZJ617 TaxID=3342119 RepID=UPI0035A846D1